MNKIIHSFFSYTQEFIRTFINVIDPSFCIVCKTFFTRYCTLLCDRCDSKITPIVSYALPISPTKQITVFAISDYQEPLKSLILSKSYSDIGVSRILGRLLWEKTYIKNIKPDCFVPIPLHWTRYAQRGYNQAEEIAQELSILSGIACNSILVRKKKTKFQFGLTKELRQENIAGAFELLKNIDKDSLCNKHIVLVDDLMTTGATLKQAALLLMAFKPRSISALVVCRVT